MTGTEASPDWQPTAPLHHWQSRSNHTTTAIDRFNLRRTTRAHLGVTLLEKCFPGARISLLRIFPGAAQVVGRFRTRHLRHGESPRFRWATDGCNRRPNRKSHAARSVALIEDCNVQATGGTAFCSKKGNLRRAGPWRNFISWAKWGDLDDLVLQKSIDMPWKWATIHYFKWPLITSKNRPVCPRIASRTALAASISP